MSILDKISKKYILFLIVFVFSVFSFSSLAHATVTPTLSLAATGNGDTVQLNVTGDPNASVLLDYIKTGSGQQITPIGTTNSSGAFTTTISSSSYGIPSGSSVYVLIGSINGPESATVSWPAVAALLSSSNALTLSQTGLVLPVGQTSTITASNLNSSTLYMSSNSNPLIANFSINGSQISVFANGYGTTTGTFCLINNTSDCSSVYVTVQNGTAQPLTFSQNSVSLYSGQTVAIQISGGNGTYSVLSNSSQNGGLVTTSISGSVITLNTTSTTGSSSITVCSSDMSSCGIINVTLGSISTTTTVSFSQSSPTVTIGQSLNVSIYGPSSSLLYVASNSNPSIVQANISGTILTLLGITSGTSTLSVCASSSNCGSLTVTVSPNYTSTGGNVILSQDTVSLSAGQNTTITISGASMPYTTLISPNNIFEASINSNILTVYGISAGSSSMSVCSNGTCASLSITVTGQSTTSTVLPAGCSASTGYSQTTGLPCTTTSTTSTNYIPADCTGSLFSVSTGLPCPTATVVSTPSGTTVVETPVVSTSTSTAATTTTAYIFTGAIKLGSTGTEVSELQQRLKTLGYYKGKIDGGFGPATEAAVKAYQKAHGLPQVGNVGPATRALLNK